MNNLTRVVFSLALVLLSSCTGQHNMEMPATTTPPTPVPGEITVLEIMAPVAPAGMTNGSVYFTLQNGTGQPLHLQGATATVAQALSFHETTNDNGVMRMIGQPDGFTVPAGENLVLAPGGKHLMLENLHAPLVAGEQFTLMLTFADAAPLTLTVPVMAHGATPMDHSMMDHNK
jgi:periplasmic copper chaperone A